jgi:VWFA-related protein
VTYARLLLCAALVAASSPGSTAQEPRFRGGTNLVRLDVYVSLDGVAVTDLTAADFEVLEDNAPQEVSAFELIRARAAGTAPTGAEPSSVAEMRSRLAQPDARAFVLFLDTLHVQLEGSSRSASPVGALLDRVVGPDDLVGVMTPEMSARNMTFSPRTVPIADMMRANWAWGERGRRDASDPREQDLRTCYPDVGDSGGVAEAVIARRRERKTLQGLADLVQHLEELREERSFVLMLTEGWLLPSPDEQLARPLQGTSAGPGGSTPIGVTPEGRLAVGADPAGGPMAWCERERSLVALSDLSAEFRLLTQRANRANVSFYPVDPRGLVVFDDATPAATARGPSLVADGRGLARRQNSLRELAAETDGTVVLNTALDRALPRLLNDVGSYYLLGYLSTNPKPDGRYRRLTVRVRRPAVQVRARPGYLAPSAAELRTSSASSAASATGASPGPVATGARPASSVTTALSRLPVARRAAAIHVSAAGGRGDLQVVVELDRTTAVLAEWVKGGSVVVDVQPADGATGRRTSGSATLAPGDRVHALRLPDAETLRPGRYQVRVQATADGGRTPLTVSTIVDVPGPAALIGSGLVASRRGPGTGRVFEPTADPRFRRTERLILDVSRLADDIVVTGRLLNRNGQVMQVPVVVSQRQDDRWQQVVASAEISLAPLAAGEYVLEISGTRGAQTETLSYALRIVS